MGRRLPPVVSMRQSQSSVPKLPVSRRYQSVLIVEDDAALRGALVRGLRAWTEADVAEASTAAAACTRLAERPTPDLVVIDVRLPDAPVFDVLDAARDLSPTPVVVAMSGKASPDEAFRLAQCGVRAYLPKPFSIEDMAAAVASAGSQAPDLAPLISASVGHVPLRELQCEVRRVMVREALAKTEGSRSAAARLLRVTRQAVQQMVRSDEPLDATVRSRKSPSP